MNTVNIRLLCKTVHVGQAVGAREVRRGQSDMSSLISGNEVEDVSSELILEMEDSGRGRRWCA